MKITKLVSSNGVRSKNLKVFFMSIAGSVSVWWGINTFTGGLENLFLAHHTRANAEFLASTSSQLEETLRKAYPLRSRQTDPLELHATSVLSLYIKEDGAAKVLFEKYAEGCSTAQ